MTFYSSTVKDEIVPPRIAHLPLGDVSPVACLTTHRILQLVLLFPVELFAVPAIYNRLNPVGAAARRDP